MDEEELQKRFTDCVYFLASPLTCKKGIECEYRHCEIARLNPRDCWFWLGGCCFNPDCAFRHPPLEGLKEAYHESSNPKNGPTLPVDKSKSYTPCYYYSNGFCNKGERCPFLHGPPASTVKNPVPVDKKLPVVNNTELPPVNCHTKVPPVNCHTEVPPVNCHTEVPPDNCHTELPPVNCQPELPPVNCQPELPPVNCQPAAAQIEHTHTEKTESTEISETECEENSDMSDSLVPVEEYVQSESDIYDDQPGFDVIVDGESERWDYEEENDDVDYLLKVKPAYPEFENSVREQRYYVYDPFYDNERARDPVSGQSRESIFYRLSHQKSNVQSRRHDLREHLKRKSVDFDFDHRNRGNPQMYESHGDIGFDFDQRIRGNTNTRRYVSGGEIGFDFDQRIRGNTNTRKYVSRERVDFDFDQKNRLRKSVPVNRYRPSLKDSRPRKPWFLGSQIWRSHKPAPQQQIRKTREESVVFKGPKSLDEIKEEKKKAQQKRDVGPFNQTGSNGFQGPRPLSEILEKKRKLG